MPGGSLVYNIRLGVDLFILFKQLYNNHVFCPPFCTLSWRFWPRARVERATAFNMFLVRIAAQAGKSNPFEPRYFQD